MSHLPAPSTQPHAMHAHARLRGRAQRAECRRQQWQSCSTGSLPCSCLAACPCRVDGLEMCTPSGWRHSSGAGFTPQGETGLVHTGAHAAALRKDDGMSQRFFFFFFFLCVCVCVCACVEDSQNDTRVRVCTLGGVSSRFALTCLSKLITFLVPPPCASPESCHLPATSWAALQSVTRCTFLAGLGQPTPSLHRGTCTHQCRRRRICNLFASV
jgi:hypothetical protein